MRIRRLADDKVVEPILHSQRVDGKFIEYISNKPIPDSLTPRLMYRTIMMWMTELKIDMTPTDTHMMIQRIANDDIPRTNRPSWPFTGGWELDATDFGQLTVTSNTPTIRYN